MSYVFNTDGSYREVTNLGWLLRHADEVERFEIDGGTMRCFKLGEKLVTIPEEPRSTMDSVMVARLRDGRVFVTRWASYSVMRDWLSRPRFATLPLRWFSVDTTC